MSHTLTRQALYELIWAEPMQTLSRNFSISDRGLAKICAAANIPVPARGYWAKLQAGHPVKVPPLPPRSLGQLDRVHIGPHTWGNDPAEDARIMSEPVPPPPVFEPRMDVIEQQVAVLVRKAPLPARKSADWHSQLAKLLAADEERERKKQASPYASLSDGAAFDSVFEKRRLRILNALFVCLTRCGMTPRIAGRHGRELSVTVGDIPIPLMLDGAGATKQIERERYGYAFLARGDSDKMRLSIGHSSEEAEAGLSWEDKTGLKIERQLRGIAAAIIVHGERRVRDGAQYAHTWRIKRKAELEEAARRRQEEEEKLRMELKPRREQAQVDHLLAQAACLEQAERIRAYVSSVRQANAAASKPMTAEELGDWSAWALAQADRIDPVRSGAFRMRPDE
jgi:hypothetical protein